MSLFEKLTTRWLSARVAVAWDDATYAKSQHWQPIRRPCCTMSASRNICVRRARIVPCCNVLTPRASCSLQTCTPWCRWRSRASREPITNIATCTTIWNSRWRISPRSKQPTALSAPASPRRSEKTIIINDHIKLYNIHLNHSCYISIYYFYYLF